MRGLLRFFTFVLAVLSPFIGAVPHSAHAADPLLLKEDFRLLELSPYMQKTADGGYMFSVQNGGSQNLPLLIKRPPENDLAIAVGLAPTSFPALRLFASDDREFTAKPGQPEMLSLNVPAKAVQSFYLPAGLIAAGYNSLYLWSPAEHAAQENRRQTFRGSMMLLLSLLTVVAIAASIYRRSRRAVYAVVMGLGLTTLLGSLWLRDIMPSQLDGIAIDRLNLIRIALAIGVFMSLLAHVNLIIQQILNRNYWTRVIIVTDALLVVSATLWGLQVVYPDFAGLLSVELANMALVATCASVFLGAVFVPDRSGYS